MLYRIVCRDRQWHLLIEGQDCAILQCDDRAFLVEIACKVAAERGFAVHVFDERDDLESGLVFRDGALAVDRSYPAGSGPAPAAQAARRLMATG